MNILVNCAALHDRGGLSVAKEFLNEVSSSAFLKDKKINLYVVCSDNRLLKYENENIKIYCFEEYKKSFFKKAIFEIFFLKRFIREHGIKILLSLQNTGINSRKLKQYVMIHQPIPFSDISYKSLEVKNIIKYSILLRYYYKLNINKYDTVFVQTDWMKKSIINNYRFRNKIYVIRPGNVNIRRCSEKLPHKADEILSSCAHPRFIYVTNTEKYKNNDRLIKAVDSYNKKNEKKVYLFLTISGKSTDYVKYLGKIPHESMYELYKNCDALIFASLLETLGLPILEAYDAGLDVLVSDIDYAHEICKENAVYFNPYFVDDICRAISTYLSSSHKKIDHKASEGVKLPYLEFIKIIYNDSKSILL